MDRQTTAHRIGSRQKVVVALGVTQILGWGSSYYLLTALGAPIAADTGWPESWIVGAFSIGLFIEGLAAPSVGHLIEHHAGRFVLAFSSILLLLRRRGGLPLAVLS